MNIYTFQITCIYTDRILGTFTCEALNLDDATVLVNEVFSHSDVTISLLTVTPVR